MLSSATQEGAQVTLEGTVRGSSQPGLTRYNHFKLKL